MGIADLQVDVAVLQERYDNIVVRLDEGKSMMAAMDAKFDEVIKGMHETAMERALEAQRRKWKSYMWTGARHLATIAGAVFLAKLLKEPLNIGL